VAGQANTKANSTDRNYWQAIDPGGRIRIPVSVSDTLFNELPNMKSLMAHVLVWTVIIVACRVATAREWTDSSGLYTLEADLVAFNQKSVVLQREDKELVAMPIELLSETDREFLKSSEAEEANRKATEEQQTWTLRDGTKLVGRIVDYADRNLIIQQRRRRIYVNDRLLNNLPEFYRQLVPSIVSHTERLPRSDLRGLQNWLRRKEGEPQEFRVQGVVLEMDNGDEYAVPFFLFTDEDQKSLQSGWDSWQAVYGRNEYAAAEDLGYLLRTLAAARAHDRSVQHEIAMLKLNLKAVQTGLTSLWEVTLYSTAGQNRPPQWVVVPGRDSRQAANTALEMNPGYIVGPIRRIAGH